MDTDYSDLDQPTLAAILTLPWTLQAAPLPVPPFLSNQPLPYKNEIAVQTTLDVLAPSPPALEGEKEEKDNDNDEPLFVEQWRKN